MRLLRELNRLAGEKVLWRTNWRLLNQGAGNGRKIIERFLESWLLDELGLCNLGSERDLAHLTVNRSLELCLACVLGCGNYRGL